MSIFHGASAVGLSNGESVGNSIGSAVSWAVADGHGERLNTMLGIKRRFGWSKETDEEQCPIYHLYFNRSGDRVLKG